MNRSIVLLAILVGAPLLMGASIRDVDREVVTVTWDQDGSLRERRIWFARLEGDLYVRTTPSATWGANVERGGTLVLMARGEYHAFEATRVDDADRIARINARFRQKYGRDDWWADRLRFFFGGKVAFLLTPIDEPGAGDG